MPETDHELLERLAYLRGAVWSWVTWSSPSEQWDHDHCVVCWARFGGAWLAEGYAAAGPAGQPEYHWLCSSCFRDRRDLFDWTVRA
jgi:hypothetical protein